MKAVEQYFHVLLFAAQAGPEKLVDLWMEAKLSVTIQTKANEEHFEEFCSRR